MSQEENSFGTWVEHKTLEQRTSKRKLSKDFILSIYTYIHTSIYIHIQLCTQAQVDINFPLKSITCKRNSPFSQIKWSDGY